MIGSGIARPVSRWLQLCFGFVDRDWHKRVKPQLDFEADFTKMVCDPSRMRSLGWQAMMNIDQLCDTVMASLPAASAERARRSPIGAGHS